MMKLRHLSIISLASKCRTISYKTLSLQLGIENIRELEDLIIEAFYAEIIKGKLDQLNSQLEIDFAIGRDVTDEQVDEILNVLDNWYCFLINMLSLLKYGIFIQNFRCKNCDVALKTIETQISNANSFKQNQLDKQLNIESEVLKMKNKCFI
jgi:COP9 signalosome complex subunit 7